MKKIALVLALLMVVSMTGVFADAAPGVYVGGAAKSTFTYDIDANAYALSNTLQADVILSFGDAIEAVGEGDVYAELKIANLRLNNEFYWNGPDGTEPGTHLVAVYVKNDDGTYSPKLDDDGNAVYESVDASTVTTDTHWSETPDWSAKIIAGPVWVKVDGDENIRARRETMANVVDGYNLLGDAFSYNGAYASVTCAGTASAGLDLEDLVSVAVKVGTASATPTVGNAFGVAVDASLKAVENLNVDASLVWGSAGNTLGAGVTAGYGVAVADMTLTPYAAADFKLNPAPVSFEVGGGLKLDWESDKDGVVSGSGWKGFFGSRTMVNSGADLAVKWDGDLDLAFTAAYLPIENLTSGAIVQVANMTSALATGFGAYLDYKVPDMVKGYGWFKATTKLDELIVGAEYIGINNTAIGAKYTYSTQQIAVYCELSKW